TVTCSDCHKGILYADKTPRDCYACHKSTDVHRRKLGTRCDTCHNSRDWRLWDFNHDTRTTFKLDGGHKGLKCDDCHTAPMDTRVKLSSACGGCHKKDDPHESRFGPHCDRCHTTTRWQIIKPDIGGLRVR
ncbi:MAG: hypothetical protein NNA24_09440, partial [Nitrospira sp.]|nr:hypothetical protein [Nitrospira sp.]